MISNRYQRPPKEITDILDVGPTPGISLSPTREFLLLIERANYPPIEDLAAPMLKLAGLRINPHTNGQHLAPRGTGLILQTIATGEQRRVVVPEGVNIGFQGWSPNGKLLAFTITTDNAIQLWVASVMDIIARQIGGLTINGAYGVPVQWLPDSSGLLVQAIIHDRGGPPVQPKAPLGPAIEESSGRSGPMRTYQDLLQNTHDEDLLAYYGRSQLMTVELATMSTMPLGSASLFASVEISPDGVHILVEQIKTPFSYLFPVNRFPQLIEVWNRRGELTYVVAALPLLDNIPIEGVPTGPRAVTWQPNQPATLVWMEALDEGDPRNTVPHRDRVLSLAAPFESAPTELVRTAQRCTGILWGEKDGLAFVRDYDRDRRWTRTLQINTEHPDMTPTLIWERSINDRYGDPGNPIGRFLPNGQSVMWQHGNFLFLRSSGATPKGDRPFLDRFDLTTHATNRLFACDDESYESVVALLADDASQFITQHESPYDPPNAFLYAPGQARKALTNFPDPMPQLRGIHKELVTYERSDGVQLSFTLYLPPGHQKGQPLPTIMWAYPREFNDHLFLLTQGYAILDEATIPVVGTPELANDTFIEQVVASAQAAIDKAVEMGVTDRDHIGVGGHSYGAFMTANLLAHATMFRTGVARSGAYNRTLTPFGFQNERRTFWEAPQIYMIMSPFAAAHKIKTPILLIHGEADNNPGTFPIQSERLYHAIRGNGGTVRYVTLPHESHGYVARESVEHTLWEMVTWFDRYVKPAKES
ncbi:MAG: prolyl oligopeptidase family serine peptidase [Planctomycetales bacterium]|nr:prolyl oligopeptidase family serine peptidase [Planctomycetales bacterium]